MGGWISVKDGLPSEDGNYLCYYRYNNGTKMFIGVLSYFATDVNPHWQHEGTGLYVTHWMHLPEPPTDKPGVLKTIYETPEICEDCYAHLSLEWSFCPECGHVTPWADGESMMNQ